MKLYSALSDLMTNKYVLYLVATMALLNVFGYISLGNFHAVVFFILVGYITSFFSKNMIIILMASMILTNFLVAGMKVKEGLTSLSEEKRKKDLPILPPFDYDGIDDVEQTKMESEEFKTQQSPLDGSNIDYVSNDEKKRKNADAHFDKEATLEQAHDALSSIVEGPEFAKMTDDTTKLMEQQKNLADSMNQFGPMLENIKPLLEQAQQMLQNIEANGRSP